MAYKWDSSLECGYELVDNQHKQLIAAVNNLVEASRSGRGDKAVMQTVDFLTGYTIKHFADEEKLQQKYDYPDYLNHKRIHDDFKVTVKELTERLVKEGPSPELVDLVSSVVGAWLLNHIKGDDFRMAAYVKAKSAEQESKE
jgi:hemerythrin-like metal-binding protein